MGTIFWVGDPPNKCELNPEHPITDQFIDGRILRGGWAIMCPQCHKQYGGGLLGVGYGQRYKKHPKGWQKVEG